jgi:membrane protein implicated in regulation of membrane protease activity
VDWLVIALYALGAAAGTMLLTLIAVAVAAFFNHSEAGTWIRTAGTIFLALVVLLNVVGYKLKRDGRLPPELSQVMHRS